MGGVAVKGAFIVDGTFAMSKLCILRHLAGGTGGEV